MSSITFYEKFNQEKLKEILMCDNFPVKITGHREWKKMIRADFEKYAMKRKTPRGIETTYNRKIKCFGRYCSSNAIQHMPKDLRCYGCGEYYRDIDQVNSHPTIIQFLFNKYNIHDVFLTDYIADRTEALTKYSLKDKEQLIKIFNYYNINKNQHESIKSFHDHIYNEKYGLLSILYKEPSTKLLMKNIEKEIKAKLKKTGKSIENIRGKVFSRYLQGIEDTCLQSMINYCETNGLVVGVLMFDGLMVERNDLLDDQFLVDMADHVFNDTGIQFKLAYKSTETDWRPIISTEELVEDAMGNSNEFDEQYAKDIFRCAKIFEDGKWTMEFDDERYKKWMDYMNQFFSQFVKPSTFAVRMDINERYEFRSINELVNQMGSGNQFGSMGFHWIHDPKRRKFSSADFIVDFKNDDNKIEYNDYTEKMEIKKNYNNYIRPPWTVVDDSEVYEKCAMFFDYLENVISSGDKKIYTLLLDWIATMTQKGKTEIAIVLLGKKGIGKSTLPDLLCTLITVDYFQVINNLNRIKSNFNGMFERNLLTVFEEASGTGAEKYSIQNQLKDMITSKYMAIEHKGVDTYMSTNNSNCIFNSNGLNPVDVTEDNRRYIFPVVSDIRQNDGDYFKAVKECVMEHRKILRGYFYTRDISNTRLKVIQTVISKQASDVNKKAIDVFVEEELAGCVSRGLSNKTIYNNYMQFISQLENQEYSKALPFKYFKLHILRNTDYREVILDKITKKVGFVHKDNIAE